MTSKEGICDCCGFEAKLAYFEFNGDWLCKECFIYAYNIVNR